MVSWLVLIQGIYYFVTGVWPSLHIQSFMKVTGPKTDIWLVKTLGAVLAVIGVVLLLTRARGELTPSTGYLAMGSALALGVAEVNYTAKKVISPIYLLDAVIEAGLIIWWLLVI